MYATVIVTTTLYFEPVILRLRVKKKMIKKADNVIAHNVVIFNSGRQKQTPKTMDSQYMELIDYEELRKKYWSHICPGIGMVSQPEAVCQRCLKTKPESPNNEG